MYSPPVNKNKHSSPPHTFFGVLLLLAFSLITTEPLLAQGGEEIVCSNAAEISKVLPKLKPGDTVVMKNGTWNNQKIEFGGKGTEGAPITLRAQTPGLVVLNGNSRLEISGEWMVVDGLRFDGGALKKGNVVQFRGALGDATHSRFTNSSIVNYNPPSKKTRYFWVTVFGQHNRVDHNYFHNQNHSGVTIVVRRDKSNPNFARIDGNHFADRPLGDGNGFETIRVGTSDQCESKSSSVIENNLFERIDGELEIISNKSGDNVFRGNTFFESNGSLTLRHGHGNLVDGNFFIGNGKDGAGGVRVIGRNQTVVNNYFSGLNGWADGAIAITGGQPNSKLNGYPQVENALIAHNTILDVKGAAIAFSQSFGSRDRTLLAENVTIANNVFYSKQDPLFEGKESSSWKWEGNIAFGQSLGSAVGHSGIKVLDPKLKQDKTGIWRPQRKSPLINNAVGDYGKFTKFDMDGQQRDDASDIGADESSTEDVTRSPLTGVDVGPPLAILLSEETVKESNAKGAVTATVVRNKNCEGKLKVTITTSDQDVIKTQKTATIAANKNSVDFAIDTIDDKKANGDQTVTITVAASGYPAATATLVVEDNNMP